MKSFRTEFETPVVEQDIIELEKKIRLFKEGKIDEERFRSLRLARGVYGQRQPGVQMIRIKLPYGKVSGEQLNRIAAVSDEYSRGKLHITTRQDIQIHYVSLDRTPELWEQLEKDDITLREACGNTVRNITASETAGIDPNEPFDVSPYAHAVFQFFLRNPVCQEMGRKFKMSFSATDEDTALSFMHDLGFIAKIKDGVRGFKVLLAGGLGSQPRQADVLYEFLEADKIIPLIEKVLRVFDRHGERTNRNKARLKFLVKAVGLEEFLKLVEQEDVSVSSDIVKIEVEEEKAPVINEIEIPAVTIEDQKAYDLWKQTNVLAQKQDGLFAIGIRVQLGDFSTDKARALADLIKKYGANELRFTLRQNILLRHIKEDRIPFFYQELSKLGFAEAGYNKVVDITACPGTDTCNLGISSSTGIAQELERIIEAEYNEFVNDNDITIKISGCMNACGQHNMAEIGFQGMTVKSGQLLAPALQVLLGGGVLGDGQGAFSDKILKIPSKRGPQALRIILDDYKANKNADEKYVAYYQRQGKMYFYGLLKDLSDIENLQPEDFIDWGSDRPYLKAVGIGECAGVVVDLVATLFFESREKIDLATDAFAQGRWSDSIYHAYASLVNSAKAVLLSEEKKTNSHAAIINQFDEEFVQTGKFELDTPFAEMVYKIKENKPSEEFADQYLQYAISFLGKVEARRKEELTNE